MDQFYEPEYLAGPHVIAYLLMRLLKIWNANKCLGVVVVFNCQGAAWCKVQKKTHIEDASPGTLTGSVRASNVDCIAPVAGPEWSGNVVVYSYRSVNSPRQVALQALEGHKSRL